MTTDHLLTARVQASLTSLSATGAALGGFGAGLLLADEVRSLALPALFAGIAVHLFGMVGLRRLQARANQPPTLMQRLGFWACWIIIAAILAYAALELAR